MVSPFLSTLVAAAVVLVDQVTKLLVVTVGYPYRTNTGGVLGLFPRNHLISWLAIIAYLALLWYGFVARKLTGRERMGFGLLLGGGLGNLADRFIRGGVVDWLSVGVGPSFNLADLAIALGVLRLSWGIVKSPRPKRPGLHSIDRLKPRTESPKETPIHPRHKMVGLSGTVVTSTRTRYDRVSER